MSKKILKIAVGIIAVGTVAKLARDAYISKKEEYLEEENLSKNDSIKTYTSFFKKRYISVKDAPFEGCELKAISSKVTLDLSKIKLNKDVYVTFSAKCSRVSIILPDNAHISLDINKKFSEVNSYILSSDKVAHTIYLIGDAITSNIELLPEHVYLDDETEEDMDAYTLDKGTKSEA